MTKIVYSHHNGPHRPGDVVDVDEATARSLVDGGAAQYAPDDAELTPDREAAAPAHESVASTKGSKK